MGKKKRETGLLLRAAERFDLPADLVAGLPYLQLLGDREFFMDSHQGILSYSESAIEISAGPLVVRLQGKGLELLSMTEEALRVGGVIERVELVR